MDRLGDFSVAERLPIAFGNGSDRRLHRYVLIGANSEDLAGLDVYKRQGLGTAAGFWNIYRIAARKAPSYEEDETPPDGKA